MNALSHVRDDSRLVQQGDIFVAVAGHKTDGHAHIESAIANGAKTIYYEQGRELPPLPKGIEAIAVEDTRLRLAVECEKRYSAPPILVAVTGTSGKSSVVDFTRQLWEMAGIRCASLGTLGVRCNSLDVEALSGGNALTSMPTVALHRVLHELSVSGITHVAMEASSHGLEQKRLHGLNIEVGVFTNLSRDHLDYHADMEAYFEAKSILFTDLLKADGKALANRDSTYFSKLEKATKKLYSFGKASESDIELLNLAETDRGMNIGFNFFGSHCEVATDLVGGFQAENMLMSAGILHFTGANDGETIENLQKLQGVAGRMQRIPSDDGLVVVDYAHKPEALRLALEVLRSYTQQDGGKLICVFGCGGDRDRGKRAEMGGISSELADITIITDDNPRSESPDKIRQDISQGLTGEYIEIGDRYAAIAEGIRLIHLHAGSVLLIAGKGHERGQIIGDKILPFDDVAVTHEIMEASL